MVCFGLMGDFSLRVWGEGCSSVAFVRSEMDSKQMLPTAIKGLFISSCLTLSSYYGIIKLNIFTKKKKLVSIDYLLIAQILP